MSSPNKIEDQEQYNGIREYRNELRHEYEQNQIGTRAIRLVHHIRALDELLSEAETRNPEFMTGYLVSKSNLGTY